MDSCGGVCWREWAAPAPPAFFLRALARAPPRAKDSRPRRSPCGSPPEGRLADARRCAALRARGAVSTSRRGAASSRAAITEAMDPAVTYGSYLHVDELLDLQRPRSEGPEHDELLFIVIHQVYELWFKEILHEIDRVGAAARGGRPASRAAHAQAHPDHPQGAGRAARHPRDDDAARVPVVSRTARGGERISVGSVPPARVHARTQVAAGDRAIRRQAAARGRRSTARFDRPTLWDAFLRYLSREGYAVPAGRARARRDGRDRAVGRDPADPGRRLSQRPEELRDLRAARRSRRGHAGVALSPRQDGRAHDWRQDRAPADRQAASTCDRPWAPRCFPTSGRSGRASDEIGRSEGPAATGTCERTRTALFAFPVRTGSCSPGTRIRRGPMSRSMRSSRPGSTRRRLSIASGQGRGSGRTGSRRVATAAQRSRRRHRARTEHARTDRAAAVGDLPMFGAAPSRRPRPMPPDHGRGVPYDSPAARSTRRSGRRRQKVAARPVEHAGRAPGGSRRRVRRRRAGVVGAVRDRGDRPGPGAVASRCDADGAPLLVDAYHHLNVVPFDLQGTELDRAFIVGGGYKYCQLGEGNCFLRVPAGLRSPAGPHRLVQRVRRAGRGAAAR